MFHGKSIATSNTRGKPPTICFCQFFQFFASIEARNIDNMWIQWLLMFSCLFQGLGAITVLEFGDKPDENAKLDINIELPTSGFSLCFQMYLMQHTDNWRFVPLHFGQGTIAFSFTTTDFDLPSWIAVFGAGTSFVINEETLELYQWTGLCLSINETAFDVVMNGIQIGSWN